MTESRQAKLYMVLLLCVATLLGCSSNPELRKQKYFDSASRYYSQEKYPEAIVQYANALRIDPRFTEARYQMARCYLHIGSWKPAYDELMKVVSEEPDRNAAQIDLGALLLAAQRPAEALQRAELVLQRDPSNVSAHLLKANAHGGLNDFEMSLQEVQSAVSLQPELSGSYLNMGLLQLQARRAASAESNFKTAISLDPKSVQAAVALGTFYDSQRRWAEAQEQLYRATTLAPGSLFTHVALARHYLLQGRSQETERVLKQVILSLDDKKRASQMLAEFYLASNDLGKAAAQYGDLAAKHHGDISLRNKLAQVLILQGQLDKARSINDDVLKQRPQNVEALIQRGWLLYILGSFDDAWRVLRQAVTLEPDNAYAHYYLGAICTSVNPAEAQAEFLKALEIRPNLLVAHRALAQMAMQQGDITMLAQQAQDLIDAAPLSAEGYLMRANARLLQRQAAAAEADLQKAIELAPQQAAPYARLALLRTTQRRYPEAERLYEEALQRDQRSAEALQGLVNTFLQQKQPARAMDRVTAQVGVAPTSANYQIMAALLEQQKQHEKSESCLQKALELDPENATAFETLAHMQMAGDTGKAIARWKKLAAQNPAAPYSYALLAVLHENTGNLQEARAMYREAFRLRPDYAIAATNLAYLMLENNEDPGAALALAHISRKSFPDSPSTADTLGWAYYRSGAPDVALELLKRAVAQDPANPTFHFHLALAYSKTGNAPEARVHLQRIVRSQPAYSRIGEVRQALHELPPLAVKR
jgi:tetratricopeptide (TPR) repeat protein